MYFEFQYPCISCYSINIYTGFYSYEYKMRILIYTAYPLTSPYSSPLITALILVFSYILRSVRFRKNRLYLNINGMPFESCCFQSFSCRMSFQYVHISEPYLGSC